MGETRKYEKDISYFTNEILDMKANVYVRNSTYTIFKFKSENIGTLNLPRLLTHLRMESSDCVPENVEERDTYRHIAQYLKVPQQAALHLN